MEPNTQTHGQRQICGFFGETQTRLRTTKTSLRLPGSSAGPSELQASYHILLVPLTSEISGGEPDPLHVVTSCGKFSSLVLLPGRRYVSVLHPSGSFWYVCWSSSRSECSAPSDSDHLGSSPDWVMSLFCGAQSGGKWIRCLSRTERRSFTGGDEGEERRGGGKCTGGVLNTRSS